MKIYVVEVILDEVMQCGFSLSREVAQKRADELSQWLDSREYFITEYEVKYESTFCDFE
jgi:hypothetical protein